MTRDFSLTQSEIDAKAQLKNMQIDHQSMAVMSNIFRVATTFRSYVEKHVLSHYDLSFTGFLVLWITWIKGSQEFKHLAIDCGVSKGTLTGLINTLEKNGYINRKPHKNDARRLMISITSKGRYQMAKIFPEFNSIESLFTADMTAAEKTEIANMLRIILHTIKEKQ